MEQKFYAFSCEQLGSIKKDGGRKLQFNISFAITPADTRSLPLIKI